MERGVLLIADINGYTKYLSGVELDHSLDVVAALVGAIALPLRGAWQIEEIEGDAVYAYAPQRAIGGDALLGTVEACYTGFADERAFIERSTSCTCRACRSVPDLDLKIIVHSTEVARHVLAGVEKFVGPGVILAHRLLKNSIAEQCGVRGYAFLSAEAVATCAIDPVALGAISHDESYDVGPVHGWVIDLGTRWADDQTQRNIFVSPEECLARLEVETTLSPGHAWDFLTTPENLILWMADDVHEERRAARGRGTVLHCVHGRMRFTHEIVDWKPFAYFTWQIRMKRAPTMHGTGELIPRVGGGTTISYRVAPADRLPNLLRRVIGRMLDKNMVGARAALLHALAVAEEQAGVVACVDDAGS